MPSLGMIATGKNAKEAAIVAEIFHHTIAVMTAASRIAPYRSLSEKEAYEMEYWELELYKLSLAPPENEFSGTIALITGAASGIGKAVALRFAQAGMHLALTDIDADALEECASVLSKNFGKEKILSVAMDVTSEKSVEAGFNRTVERFGGLDIVVSNAGIATSSAIDEMTLQSWEKSLKVNATGHFLVSRCALRILKKQGLGGSLIFNGSKNVFAPGKDFAAYSAAKSAETQLAKIAAMEGGPYGIRANILHPDAVFEDSKLWSDEMKRKRAKAQGIRPSQVEEFYRTRNLLQTSVRGSDVAEAALFFASGRSSKTTGCSLTVDGGLREAFPR